VVRLSRGDYDIVQNFGEEAAANSSGFFVHREPVQLVGCAGVDEIPPGRQAVKASHLSRVHELETQGLFLQMRGGYESCCHSKAPHW
jgi:hypothetical protein